jgi:hypothetical protein
MQKIKTKIIASLVGMLFLIPAVAFAQNAATVELRLEEVGAQAGTELTFDLYICTEGEVTTFDISVTFNNIVTSGEVDGDNDNVQIFTEESFEEGTARVVGGQPGGLEMDLDGCIKIAEITVISEAGELEASVDFENSKTLGDAEIDPTIDENATIEITVSEAEETEDTTDDETHASADVLDPPEITETIASSGSVIIKWEADPEATMHKVEYIKTSELDNEDAQYTVIDVLGESTILAALEPETGYTIRMKSVNNAGDESEVSEIVEITTEALPAADVGEDETEAPDAAAAVIQEPAGQTAQAEPQPVVYQTPAQQEPFTHAGSGPEHVIVAVISLALVSYFYLRKKLA